MPDSSGAADQVLLAKEFHGERLLDLAIDVVKEDMGVTGTRPGAGHHGGGPDRSHPAGCLVEVASWSVNHDQIPFAIVDRAWEVGEGQRAAMIVLEISVRREA